MIDPRRSRLRRKVTLTVARLQRGPRPIARAVGFAFRSYHWGRLRFFALMNGWRHRGERPAIDPFEIIRADPRSIDRCVLGVIMVPGATWRNVGRVRDGDWDLRTRPFETLRTVRALEERFVHGARWEDTEYYRRAVDSMARGHVRWDCLTEAEFARRCERIDLLHDAIRRRGYRSQRELGRAGRREDPFDYRRHFESQRRFDEVVVCIGRSGELLFADGQHRLGLAQILNVPEIPVRVLLRHRRWQELRARVDRYAGEELEGRLPHALPHPDLGFVRPARNSRAWAELVGAALDDRSRSILEVDAGIGGFFSTHFERLGRTCVALEEHPVRRKLLTEVRDACGRRFRVACDAELQREGHDMFDAVLVLDPASCTRPGSSDRLLRLTRRASRDVFLAVDDSADSLRDGDTPGCAARTAERLSALLLEEGIGERVDSTPFPSGGGVLLHAVRPGSNAPGSHNRSTRTTTRPDAPMEAKAERRGNQKAGGEAQETGAEIAPRRTSTDFEHPPFPEGS